VAPVAGWSTRLRPGIAVLLLAGCGEVAPPSFQVVVHLERDHPDFGTVDVHGLPDALRRGGLSRLEPSAPDWTSALAVRAFPPGEHDGVPPLAGRYRVTDDGLLRFAPRYPPSGGLEYRVRLDPTRLARLAGARALEEPAREWAFQVPAAGSPAASTEIVAVHPSATVVPANQLRWYVEFSAPMREGESLRHVALLDARGRALAGAFLDPGEELWDPDGRRLTVLFDPGRVKEGIRTRLEQGPVLQPGRQYTLRIDAAWPDARGAPLVRGYEHRFTAGPTDHTRPDPRQWALRVPRRGTREPLEVRFGEPLDHALASRLVAVYGADGLALPGAVTMRDDDWSWRFVPEGPWASTAHELRVHPGLEDVAGNSVAHVFDADVAADERAAAGGRMVVRPFVPR
jgi:hypothetical protein